MLSAANQSTADRDSEHTLALSERSASEAYMSSSDEDEVTVADDMSVQQSLATFRAPVVSAKPMTAAEFEERVCSQLKAISESYAKTAQRIEKTIAQTEKTMKVCDRANQKIDRFVRIQKKNLNEGF